MRYLCFLTLFACGTEVPYSPVEQDFEDFDAWGDGIAGFELSQTGPVDTGNGGGGDGDVNGVFLGDYSVSIARDDYGDVCNGGNSLTVAVAGGSISVGQGTSANLDCGYCSDGMTKERIQCEGSGYSWITTATTEISLKFTGTFDETGLIIGDVVDETDFNVQMSWTGVYSQGLIAGSFEQYVSSSFGMVNVVGQANVIKN